MWILSLTAARGGRRTVERRPTNQSGRKSSHRKLAIVTRSSGSHRLRVVYLSSDRPVRKLHYRMWNCRSCGQCTLGHCQSAVYLRTYVSVTAVFLVHASAIHEAKVLCWDVCACGALLTCLYVDTIAQEVFHGQAQSYCIKCAIF